MENTINKQNFFAQYWGQRVWRRIHTNGEKVLLYVNANTLYHKDGNIGDDYLELKPLSSITDEDHEIITEIKNSKNLIGSIPKNNINATYLIQEQVDYLRSKGYAVPYMGLSVEQLQEYGWIKLKSE